jgi:hypothetical protein
MKIFRAQEYNAMQEANEKIERERQLREQVTQQKDRPRRTDAELVRNLREAAYFEKDTVKRDLMRQAAYAIEARHPKAKLKTQLAEADALVRGHECCFDAVCCGCDDEGLNAYLARYPEPHK